MPTAPVETYTHLGVTVSIYYDEYPTSPREWDNVSVMVCQADRYMSPDDPQFPMEREAFDRGDYPLLERYLRAACGVAAFGLWQSQRDCWGYSYVTRERAEELGVTDPEAARQAEEEEYCDWAQGNVYGYVVDEDGPDEDSCWGFIGDSDYCKEEADAAAAWVAAKKAIRQSRRGRPLHHATIAQAQA